MKTIIKLALAATAASTVVSATAFAEGLTIGVSWSNFQEERWKTDEAAMKAAIEANGDRYISADAQLSASKQLSDVESLIAQGADALVILSVDSGSVGAAGRSSAVVVYSCAFARMRVVTGAPAALIVVPRSRFW